MRLPAGPKGVREKGIEWVEKKRKEKGNGRALERRKAALKTLAQPRPELVKKKKKKKKKKSGGERRKSLQAQLASLRRRLEEEGRRPSTCWQYRALQKSLQKARG